MWPVWTSETLQKRLSDASVALQKRLTSGLHVLLGVFIHRGRFYDGWPVDKALWSTTSVCASVHGSSCARLLTPDLVPKVGTVLRHNLGDTPKSVLRPGEENRIFV
jgi:hypothetical protein